MRKGGKWAGLVTCAVIAAVWVGSAWWMAEAGLATRGNVVGVGIRRGRVIFHIEKVAAGDTRLGYTILRVQPTIHLPLIWIPELERYGFGNAIHVPLYLALLLAAVPTGLLWRADRRASRRELARHCTGCGYPRTGLAPDTKCPECGAVPAK